MNVTLGASERSAVSVQVRARLTVATQGRGFTDLTRHLAGFLGNAGADEGLLSLFMRHTSASLTVQENADPDVRADLLDALSRLAPERATYRHDIEGHDDMPAHIRTMLTDSSLVLPVSGGGLALGTWQAVYLVEHRVRPHRREVDLTFLGSGLNSDKIDR